MTEAVLEALGEKPVILSDSEGSPEEEPVSLSDSEGSPGEEPVILSEAKNGGLPPPGADAGRAQFPQPRRWRAEALKPGPGTALAARRSFPRPKRPPLSVGPRSAKP